MAQKQGGSFRNNLVAVTRKKGLLQKMRKKELKVCILYLHIFEGYSELNQTCKMELFEKSVDG